MMLGKVVALLERALELQVFFAQSAAFDGLRDLHEQFVVGPRLGDVILRAALKRGARHVDRAVSGNQHDGKIRIAPPDFAQQVEAVAVGQADVQQQEIEGLFVEQRQARFAGLRARRGVAFRIEQEFQALADFEFVVDDQDQAFRHEPLSAPQGIRAGMTFLCPPSSARPLFRRAP